MTPIALSFLTSGVSLSMVCAIIGLAFAIGLILTVKKASAGNARMKEIAGAIQEGAKAYLNRQVITISAIAILIFILLFIFKDHPTAIGFLIGAACSLAAGFIGMRIAVLANTRTTEAARKSRTAAMRIAFNGGAVTGLLVVGLALLSVGIFYTVASKMIGHNPAISSLIGLALGASLISVFARLGGGIYTKAADVGADLVGKIESGLEEDDPRNPATIADNVGDNVGDCAGMAADVFETYAVSLIGAILVGALTLANTPAAVVYPFILGGISVLGAICGILFVNLVALKPANALMGGVLTSGIVSAILFWPATHYLFPNGVMIADALRSPNDLYLASLVGLLMTGVVVVITNYYTSTAFGPVRKIAKASETGRSDGVAFGHRFHGITDSVEFVGYLAHFFWQVAHHRDTAGVVGDGSKSIERDDDSRHREHAHNGDRDSVKAGVMKAEEDGQPDKTNRQRGRVLTNGQARNDIGGVAGLGGLGDFAHRTESRRGVVIGDDNHHTGHEQADE